MGDSVGKIVSASFQLENAFYPTSRLNWTLDISPSLIKKYVRSPTTGLHFVHTDIKRMTEGFWISEYNWCSFCLYSEFTIGSIEFLGSCRVQICSFCLSKRSSVVFSSDRSLIKSVFGWIKKDSCDLPVKITVITENTILKKLSMYYLIKNGKQTQI